MKYSCDWLLHQFTYFIVKLCLSIDPVYLFHQIVVSGYSISVHLFIKYQLTSVILSKLRSRGKNPVLKRQGSVSESLANNCLVHLDKRSRGIQILAIQVSS